MNTKIFHIITLFFFVAGIPLAGYGNNTNTREYCQELIDSAKKEYDRNNFTRCIELLTEAENLSKKNNWIDLKIKTLNSLGVTYRFISDSEKAIECFLAGYELAVNNSDERQQMLILNNISEIYFVNNEINKSKDYLERGYKIAIQLQDSLMMGRFTANLAILANATNELDKANNYLDISIAMLKNQKDINTLTSVQEVKVRNLYLRGQYNKAEQLAIEILNKIPIGEEDDIRSQLFLLLSQIKEQKGDFKEAVSFAKEALNAHLRLANKIKIYEQLSQLYRNNDNTLALLYQDSVLLMKDSLAKLNDVNRVKNNQIRFDLLNSEKELAESRARQKGERTLFISILIFIFVLAIILIWIFRIQSVKNKQQKIILENEQKIIKLELEKEKKQKLIIEQHAKELETLALLEQERLNNEIELKNNQLVAKALFQSSRDKLIREIIYILSQIPNYFQNPILESIVHKLQMQLNNSTDLDDFLSDFEQINPTLFSVLKSKHPNLTTDDIRLLSYILLYTDIRKVASLLDLSTDACQKRKERLANKMGIKTIDLQSYLSSLIHFSSPEENL
jgi:hypothetical protein